MIFKITKDFSKSELLIKNEQVDYHSFRKDNVLLFIYGHPIDFRKKTWAVPELIYDYYQKGNWNFIDSIDGVFSIIILDSDKNKLFVITDRIGIYTMFYYQDAENFFITDNLKELKQECGDFNLNMTSIIELLNLGFKIGNKTLFENIFEFEPARIYEFDNQFNKQISEYWSVFDLKQEDKLSIEEFRNLYNHNLDIISDLEEEILLPISGGKDTRMLLSAILEKKEKLLCYTFGPHFHSDVTESKKICDHLGIKHDIIESNDDWARNIDFTRDLADMNINGIGPYFFNLLVKEALEREKDRAKLVLQGDLGNQMWRHHPFGTSVPDSMDPYENALWMLQNLTRVLYFKADHTAAYQTLYRKRDINDIKELLQSSIRDDLMGLKNPDKPSDYSEYFIIRTLAYNFYSNILKYIGKHFKLFVSPLQKDLLQQLHLLTIEERFKGGHIDYLIAKNNSYLSNLPYYNSGRILKYIKMITNTISQKSFRFNVFNHPELHNYPKWIRHYFMEYFNSVLDTDNMVLADLFDPYELKKHVDTFMYEKFNVFSKKGILYKYSNQHFIFNLFSLEHWLQNS